MLQVGREENQAFLPAPLPFLQQLHGGGSSCPLGTGDAYRVAGGRGVYRQNGKNPPWETYTWVKYLGISVIRKRPLRKIHPPISQNYLLDPQHFCRNQSGYKQ